MDNSYNPEVYSAMQDSTPFATFKKTVLGKVYVTVVSPFTKNPEGVLLYGELGEPTSFIDVWSEMEKMFFYRMNRKHFDAGTVIEVTREKEKEQPKRIEQSSDVELTAALSYPFTKFAKLIRETSSEALLYRFISLAEQNEKSEKVINLIKARLAEIQASEGIVPTDGNNNNN